MKPIRRHKGQVWRTYAFDPSLCVAEAASSLKRYAVRSLPIPLLPGEPGKGGYIMSNDPRVANLKVALAEKLTSSFPAGRYKEYPDANAVLTNFYSIRTDCQPMSPIVPPLPDNKRAREERGLADGWKLPAHRALFLELLDAMLENWEPGPLKVANFSTSGWPAFVTQAPLKAELFKRAITRLPLILRHVQRRDMAGLYRDTGLVLGYRMQIRLQTDRFELVDGEYAPVARSAPTEEFALTNGASGGVVPVDRACRWDNRLVPARARSVYGLSNTPNLLIASLFDGYNRGLFHAYPSTFKHRTNAEIEEKLNVFPHHVASDVSNHDFLVPEFIMSALFDALRERWSSAFVDIIELCWRAPAYVPGPDPYSEPNPYWLGHPLNPDDFNHWYGVPSGHFLVSFTGKLGCMAVYLAKLHDCGIPLLGRVKEFLRFEHPDVRCLNMGDDSVTLFRSAAHAAAYEKALGKQDYYATGVEPLSFLGNVIYKRFPEEERVYLAHSPLSYFTNFLVAERGLGSHFRKFWVLGLRARDEVYRDMPLFSKMRELFLREFYDSFGYEFDTAVNAHPDARNVPSVGQFSNIDLQILTDPSKLQFRFDHSDASPDVAGQFLSLIKEDDYLPFVLKYKL